MSPPCVEPFDGDNGGRTWRGVTRHEVRVALYNDLCVEGDMNAPDRPGDGVRCFGEVPAPDLVRTIKALVRYFNDRFQTYGRTVRVIAVPSSGADRAARASDAARVANSRVFATVPLAVSSTTYIGEVARRGVVAIGSIPNVPAGLAAARAPYVWTFQPDRLTAAALSAGFVCRSLWQVPRGLGRPQVPFALVYEEEALLPTLARALAIEVEDRCRPFELVERYADQLDGLARAAAMLAGFQARNIGSIVCYCRPGMAFSALQTAATAAGYLPLWYVDPASGMDSAPNLRAWAAPSQTTVGTTFDWRRPPLGEDHPARAYREATRDGSRPNMPYLREIYYGLLQLFAAVQTAGPHVTPDATRSGLFGYEVRAPWAPFLPTGGYGPGHEGRYSFIDTAMAWRWDPNGTPPGGRWREGCLRLARGGARSYHDTWPIGDGTLFHAAPCAIG